MKCSLGEEKIVNCQQPCIIAYLDSEESQYEYVGDGLYACKALIHGKIVCSVEDRSDCDTPCAICLPKGTLDGQKNTGIFCCSHLQEELTKGERKEREK